MVSPRCCRSSGARAPTHALPKEAKLNGVSQEGGELGSETTQLNGDISVMEAKPLSDSRKMVPNCPPPQLPGLTEGMLQAASAVQSRLNVHANVNS
jgi:hypothetical protein